jgi:hypothetical protein
MATQRKSLRIVSHSAETADYYLQFNPFVYSIEHCFPLVNLGMKDHWAPSHGTPADLLVLHWWVLRWMHGATVCGAHIFQWNERMSQDCCACVSGFRCRSAVRLGTRNAVGRRTYGDCEKRLNSLGELRVHHQPEATSRNGGDLVPVEVLAAFFGSEVTGDAVASE